MKKIKILSFLLALCVLFQISNLDVYANGQENEVDLEYEIVLQEDGTYEVDLDQGMKLVYEVDGEPSLSRSSSSKTTFNVYLYTSSKKVIFKHTMVMSYYYDYTYVGITSVSKSLTSDYSSYSVTYTTNSYSTSKYTTSTQYKTVSKITVNSKTYNLTQYIKAYPSGLSTEYSSL